MEAFGGGGSHAARSTCNQRNFVLQSVHAGLLSIFCIMCYRTYYSLSSVSIKISDDRYKYVIGRSWLGLYNSNTRRLSIEEHESSVRAATPAPPCATCSRRCG